MKKIKPKVMVAVPCMEKIDWETVLALFNLPRGTKNAEVHFVPHSGSLVYNARNIFCNTAVQEDYDYIMFIDSDMIFPANVIDKLLALDADVATAVCYGRAGNHNPQVYVEMQPATKDNPNTVSRRPDSVEGVFEIRACGMACCLVGVGLIKEMQSRGINPFEPFGNLGEDFSFCVRAQALGAEMYADGTIPIYHKGVAYYGKEHWVKDPPPPSCEDEKK